MEKMTEMLMAGVGSTVPSQKQSCFATTSQENRSVFVRYRNIFNQAVLKAVPYITLEPFLTEEAGFTTVYRVYKYCHHCPAVGLKHAVSAHSGS